MKKRKGRFCVICLHKIIVDGVPVKTGGWRYCSQKCIDKSRGIKTPASKLPQERFSEDVKKVERKPDTIRVARYSYNDSKKWEAYDKWKNV